MPTYLRAQEKWDPLLLASEKNPLFKVTLFGSSMEIEVLIEMWQEAFDSLMHLIENINRSGYSCHDKLNCSHLVMIKNRFELRDGVKLCISTPSSYNRDYHGGGEVIEEVLNHVYGPGALEKVPDLQRLVKKMKDRCEVKGYPLLVDPSLMPLHNRGPATIDVYNYLTFEMSEEFQEELLSGLVYTKEDHWISVARQNDLLFRWLDAGIICSKASKAPKDFIGYLRHCYSHILDFRRILENIHSKWANKRLKKYSKKHAQLVIYGNYRLALSDIYSRLWGKKKLKNLNPHVYFRYRQ